jgi:predicted DNA-binding protein (MmcQ/YjbR family)
MDREQALTRCRALRAATEEFPFGPSAAVFKVGGKMFAIVSVDDRPGSVSLKCDPGYAQSPWSQGEGEFRAVSC